MQTYEAYEKLILKYLYICQNQAGRNWNSMFLEKEISQAWILSEINFFTVT